ncbi:AMP-binding protein [Methylobacterium symbioticum]|uniref:AMP-binding protein n=1 Tax=uncultured Methylobacterium sp. TaxID=157278 RepID=UPI002597F2A5|nr:AMP-binding protein [uncultured Methylobacterium sp.]
MQALARDLAKERAEDGAGEGAAGLAGARPPQARRPAAAPAATPPGLGLPARRTGLGALLAATAARHPTRPALIDRGDKPGWCGRPAMTWSYGAAAEIVARLARGIRRWRLPPGSRVGLWFAGGSEGLVAHLAVEAAGHVPCPMPAAWDEAQILAAVEAAGIGAVLTQGRLGARRPAETLCRVALQVFSLRYLAAFGPDVPDGVINLDAMALERGAPDPAVGEGAGGLISFAGRDPARPVHRPGDALLAAVAAHLVAARIGPGERLLTLLPPDDLRGLVTGLGAALVAGASLETLPVFDGAALDASLADQPGRPLHLVAPAFLEGPLRDRIRARFRDGSHERIEEGIQHEGPGGTGPTLVLAHRAPARLTGRRLTPGAGTARIVDTLALDEDAVISRARGADDIALALADPASARFPAGLIELSRNGEGGLSLRGPACRAASLGDGAGLPEPGAWRPAPYRTALFAGTATALEPCPLAR